MNPPPSSNPPTTIPPCEKAASPAMTSTKVRKGKVPRRSDVWFGGFLVSVTPNEQNTESAYSAMFIHAPFYRVC